MKEHLTQFFSVPSCIRGEFWEDSQKKNKLSMTVVCIIIIGAELYNIARVLFWSNSGLGTLNNRIYFGMYCALLTLAAVWLAQERLLRSKSRQLRWGVEYCVILLLLLWHVFLNTYDLYRNHGAGTMVFTTAVLALAIFIQMPSCFSVVCFGGSYLLFMLLAYPLLSEGAQINLTITCAVALAVSLTNARHTVIALQQRREITQMNMRLQELARKDSLTELLNKRALEHRAEQCLAQGEGLTFVILDLDDFKDINDSYGHPCGDYVLMETALKLRTVFSGAAGIGRIGGDEFAVVLTGLRDEAVLRDLGGQLMDEIRHIHWRGRQVGASCSVGICLCSRPDMTYEQLYLETDRILYAAKRAGKGRCRLGSVPARAGGMPEAREEGEHELYRSL